MDISIQAGKAMSEGEYLDKIGFQKTNISNVRAGRQSFTRDHILNACKFTGASADWVFGLTNEIYRKEPKSVTERLRAIVNEMEEQ